MKPGMIWAFFPVVILGMSVVFHVVLITMAPTIAVEENYYEKALDWDAERARQAHNRELGWSVKVEVNNAALDPVQRVKLTGLDLKLTDRDGRPVAGAIVQLEAFHFARAAQVLKASLTEADRGTYRAALRMTRSGKWEIRLRATRGADVFTWHDNMHLRVR